VAQWKLGVVLRHDAKVATMNATGARVHQIAGSAFTFASGTPSRVGAPACQYQWAQPQCLRCHEISAHEAWYE
jgi:hypothetical protein